MRRISIYSRFKAADPALWILVVREIAHCETVDGRFVCRGKRFARTRTRACTCTAGAASSPANASEAALVCRGVSPADRNRLGPHAAEALFACATIHFTRQRRAAERFAAGDQRQP